MVALIPHTLRHPVLVRRRRRAARRLRIVLRAIIAHGDGGATFDQVLWDTRLSADAVEQAVHTLHDRGMITHWAPWYPAGTPGAHDSGHMTATAYGQDYHDLTGGYR